MSQLPEYDELFKVVLVGNSGVGKSKLLARFTKDEFLQDSKATIGIEFAHKDIHIQNQLIRAQIWDTGGQERYRSITAVYYRDAVGALLVYDVSNRKSFNDLDRWLKEVRTATGDETRVLVIGNKSDLTSTREVSLEEAARYAETNGLKVIETSAKDSSNVQEAFLGILNDIFNKHRPSPSVHSRGSKLSNKQNSPKKSGCC